MADKRNYSRTGTVTKSWSFWIPTIIALIAAASSAAQWVVMMEQKRLAFDATIEIDVNTLLRERRVGMAIRNVGPGLAILRSVTYYVDGNAVDDPDDILAQAKLDSDRDFGWNMDRGNSMAPGETDWLVDYHAARKEDQDRAIDFVEKHLQIGVDYSTAAGVNKQTCSTAGGC
jgi:hypothetical protein